MSGRAKQSSKASAMAILCTGQRPTAEQVRQTIGQGAQQTILTALDEFWAEVGERLREPRLPEALVNPVRELWVQALEEAQRQWASEKARLEMDSQNLRVQLDAVVLENSDLIAAVETARAAATEAEARSHALRASARLGRSSSPSLRRSNMKRTWSHEY